MFEKTKIRYNNAKLVINQIRAGEWTPGRWHDGGRYYIASRGSVNIWLANGPFFCEGFVGDAANAKGSGLFGLIFRHWVWWAAARHLANTKRPLIDLSEHL